MFEVDYSAVRRRPLGGARKEAGLLRHRLGPWRRIRGVSQTTSRPEITMSLVMTKLAVALLATAAASATSPGSPRRIKTRQLLRAVQKPEEGEEGPNSNATTLAPQLLSFQLQDQEDRKSVV